jgi:predicted metal-dependent hydrolase
MAVSSLADGSGIEMNAQLPLLSGSDTRLVSDARVVLAIRESLRARHLIIQVLPPRTVEVVVPKGMGPGLVESFVNEHREWIRRAGRELLETYPEPEFRPAVIELPAIDRSVPVRYLPANGRARLSLDSEGLTLRCSDATLRDTPALLRRFMLRLGRDELKPRLLREAAGMGLRPAGVQVRLQKTRWGSCSSSGVISLNAALLLVSPELMRYLFVHELCHMRHLSHSKRYWEMVARHEPDFRRLDRRLNDCWRHMPTWLPVGGSGKC